jgi:hypothetical protein
MRRGKPGKPLLLRAFVSSMSLAVSQRASDSAINGFSPQNLNDLKLRRICFVWVQRLEGRGRRAADSPENAENSEG